MKKICLSLPALLLINLAFAQTWLPVGLNTPYSSGTYSVNDKAYTLFRDTVDPLLYASGDFDTAGTIAADGVAAWNGTSWVKRGSERALFRAFIRYNGTLYAGGQFMDGSSYISGLAKWNGSSWTKVEQINGVIQCMAVYKGNLYVGGNFTTIGGITSTNIASWNGSNWSAIPGGISGSDGIADMLVHNNELYFAGAKELAKWDGTTSTDIHYGLTAKAYALTVYKNEVIVGGGAGVARLNGTSWTILGGGTDKDVFDLKEFNGNLYVAGQFSTINAQNIRKIAKWNGTTWTEAGQLPDVFNLAVYNSQLYAAGDMGIAKLNEIATEINELPARTIGAVFPNPSSGKFSINLIQPSDMVRVSIVDFLGNEVYNAAFSQSPCVIDLADLAPGYYLVKLSDTEGMQSHKILIY